jgi:glycosyltransferase involved in cell wall biosynthesis
VRQRGGEQVLDAIAELFPSAPIYTHVARPEALTGNLVRDVRTTFIARLPFAQRIYPAYVGLMPFALEQLDLSEFDLLISSEAGPAKGVIAAPGAKHVCYVHSPMRYAWDQRFVYRQRVPPPLRLFFDLWGYSLRERDFLSAARVDHFVANSIFVKQRIASYYRRDATVIYPPVRFSDLKPTAEVGDYYLFAGHGAGYKRLDLVLEAFAADRRRLVIAGEVPRQLRARYQQPNIEFVGHLDRASLVRVMASCRALVFPGVEDFGIVPVEVMASGRPVIAYGRGGICETLTEGVGGLLFTEQTTAALMDAVRRFEAFEPRFSPEACRESVLHFSRAAFLETFSTFVEEIMR